MISRKGNSTSYSAYEVPVEERPAIIEDYRRKAGRTVAGFWEKMPDPRIIPYFVWSLLHRCQKRRYLSTFDGTEAIGTRWPSSTKSPVTETGPRMSFAGASGACQRRI